MDFNTDCYYPRQCDSCGRELINMGCNVCHPQERFLPPPAMWPTTGSPTQLARLGTHLAKMRTEKNRGGFPRYGQLTVLTPPSSPQERPRSPRKPAANSTRVPFRRFQFQGIDGKPINVSDGTSTECPPVMYGHHRPFSMRAKEGETFTVLAKFESASHKWETNDLPCHRETTNTTLFKCLCIHFPRFVETMERCSNSERCLCGGSTSSATKGDAKILGYELFDMSESFKIVVKAETSVSNVQ